MILVIVDEEVVVGLQQQRLGSETAPNPRCAVAGTNVSIGQHIERINRLFSV